MGKVVLNVQDLNKVYGSDHKALTHISFEVQPGEFVAVIGASGSGKSTLLRCLNGLTECTSGQIYFDQRRIPSPILSRKPEDRRKLAMIFQQFNLVERHSVMSNVLMGKLSETPTIASLFRKFSEQNRKAAQEALKMVGIFDKARARADQLSGGQQQRVAIARALVQEPEILLADEPVSSLDPVNSIAVMGYLKKINKDLGLTVICNLHSIGLVKKFSTRVLALKAGRIFFDGSARQLTNEIVTNIYGQSLEYSDEVQP